jgi:hypothetical protein
MKLGPHLKAQGLEMEEVADVGITALAKKEQERKLAGKRGVANFLFVFICPAIPSLTIRLEVLPTHAPRRHKC